MGRCMRRLEDERRVVCTGDVVVAVNAFNLGREVRIAKNLIERKTPVADADLADEGIKLRDLAR